MSQGYMFTTSHKAKKQHNLHQPMIYQIRVQGHLGPQWQVRFEGLTITLEEEGTTLLTGLVADQAALYGLLRKVRDLGLPLLFVNCLEASIETHQ